MKCPFCDSEMEKGYVQANRGMAWTKKIHLFDLVSPNKGEIIFHIKNAFCKAYFDAYICKTCKKILVDYSNYEDYDEG